jgi:hypothetical protein
LPADAQHLRDVFPAPGFHARPSAGILAGHQAEIHASGCDDHAGLYHCAPRQARQSVLRHGLDPAYDLTNDRSADPFGPSDEDGRLGQAAGVWIYTSLSDAREEARERSRWGQPQDIWRINTDLLLIDDPFASTANGYYTDAPVACDALTLAN